MPNAPPIVCSCGGRRTNGVCDRCGPRKRARDERKSAAERGYDYRWQKFREVYLTEHPLCLDCQERGLVRGATDIHHKTKLRNSLELQYELSNLVPLCHECHSKRTAKGE